MYTLMKALSESEPGKVEWATSLGIARNNLGKMALLRGDVGAAVIEYSADYAIQNKLAKHNPKDNNQQEKVLISRATLGRTLAMAGEVDAGIGHLGTQSRLPAHTNNPIIINK